MLSAQDAAVIKGMLARGDKQHDIAAHFGENGGRIADIKLGKKFTEVHPAPASQLPPSSAKVPRFVDPKASLDDQIEQLRAFINNPPENGRWVVYTPKLSEWILATLNHNNRRMRPRNIRRFAEAMSKPDGWSETGDTVKFSREGTLLDGQNRFAASVASGKAFKTLTAFGIKQEAFGKIDANAIRNNTDTLKIAGVSYSQIVASAVRWLMVGQDRSRGVTNTELLDYYREKINEEEMQLAARRATAAGHILPQGSLTALLYQFERKSKKAAEAFASDLEQQKRGARSLLHYADKLKHDRMGRVPELVFQAMIILAWNAYRNGEKVTVPMLKWSDNKEFPSIA